jgi:hypothetical protein
LRTNKEIEEAEWIRETYRKECEAAALEPPEVRLVKRWAQV